MLSDADQKRSRIIFNLLKEATSQQVVREFLKDKGIATSGSWEVIYSERILPALKSKKLELVDLEVLLREVEEHGRQHIFVYKCKPDDAEKLLKRSRIEDIAATAGLSHLITQPHYVEMPDQPEVVDIRLNEAPNGSGLLSLTIKVCETRESSKYVGDDFDPATSRRIKIYEIKKKRAICIAHLGLDGILELRIASRDTSKYDEQISMLIRLVNSFFPMDSFEKASLSKAKETLFNKQEELEGQVRYTNTTAKNDFGVSLNLAAFNLTKSLMDDDGSTSAIKEFLAKNGFVTGSNIWFIIPDDVERQIHTVLNGEVHEFAIPAACTPGEYSYVFRKILSFN